jgi:hypothetical protein
MEIDPSRPAAQMIAATIDRAAVAPALADVGQLIVAETTEAGLMERLGLTLDSFASGSVAEYERIQQQKVDLRSRVADLLADSLGAQQAVQAMQDSMNKALRVTAEHDASAHQSMQDALNDLLRQTADHGAILLSVPTLAELVRPVEVTAAQQSLQNSLNEARRWMAPHEVSSPRLQDSLNKALRGITDLCASLPPIPSVAELLGPFALGTGALADFRAAAEAASNLCRLDTAAIQTLTSIRVASMPFAPVPAPRLPAPPARPSARALLDLEAARHDPRPELLDTLAQHIRWQPHPSVGSAIERRAMARGQAPAAVRRTALERGILGVFAREVTLGVTARKDGALVPLDAALTADAYWAWFCRDVIHHAEAWLYWGVKVRAAEGARRAFARGPQPLQPPTQAPKPPRAPRSDRLAYDTVARAYWVAYHATGTGRPSYHEIGQQCRPEQCAKTVGRAVQRALRDGLPWPPSQAHDTQSSH